MLENVQADTSDALENLRQLARGIYPPLLADKGLVAALEAQVRRAPVPVLISGDGVGRFGQDVEEAVYFSCLEALQNVAKYAEATQAELVLTNGGGVLQFKVTTCSRPSRAPPIPTSWNREPRTTSSGSRSHSSGAGPAPARL